MVSVQKRRLTLASLPPPVDGRYCRTATGTGKLAGCGNLSTLKRLRQDTERRLALSVVHLMVVQMSASACVCETNVYVDKPQLSRQLD